jgi:hypothetical protein
MTVHIYSQLTRPAPRRVECLAPRPSARPHPVPYIGVGLALEWQAAAAVHHNKVIPAVHAERAHGQLRRSAARRHQQRCVDHNTMKDAQSPSR